MARGDTTSQARAGGETLLPAIVMMLVVLALTLLGCVMIFSASSISAITEDVDVLSYLRDQVLFTGIGVVAAVVFWVAMRFRTWTVRVVWGFWILSLVLLLLTAVMGTTALGAQRWLQLGPISLQPSEFAKIGIILMAAYILHQYTVGAYAFRGLLMAAFVLLGIPIALIYFTQSDLGSTMIIALGILGVMWFGEVPKRVIGIFVALAFVFVLFAVFGTGYRSDRLLFIDPWNDGEGGRGTGYQIIHSFYAFSEGGIFGVGLGNSREKFLYLPESETDFIFAIIGEELGMVGAMLVVIAFLVLLWAGMSIARSAQDDFGTMIAGALTIMLVFQAFLNIGCVIGLLPTTGKPLPFISSGGSSLIASFIMVGIILSVADFDFRPRRDAEYERRRGQLRVVRMADDGSARSGARR